MTFGERIKDLLEEREISQRQLASALNIAYSTLNGYLNDYRQPDYQQLITIAQYFGVSTDYLLGATNIPTNQSLILNENSRRLLHYYQRLNPDMQQFAIHILKSMYEFNDLKK